MSYKAKKKRKEKRDATNTQTRTRACQRIEPKKLHGGYCPSATLNSEHPFVAVLLAHD